MIEEFFMKRAIELAKNGEGFTNPNPLVGSVIVKDGKIIGEGWHTKYGSLHAEREALADCKKRGINPFGATIYVTLEPCCHTGKQPPCTKAIVEAGIKKVVVGSRDPNPLVHGKGNAFLRENGIEVQEDFLRKECDKLNPIFFHYITTKTPYVALKYAMTADGKIATKDGFSKWITGEKSRNFVHKIRNLYAGILCGIGTVLKDDPLLTCRIPNGANPVRIVCDSFLKIPLESNLVKTAKEVPLIVACLENNNSKEFVQKKMQLEECGVHVMELPYFCADEKELADKNELTDKKEEKENQQGVNLKILMQKLGEQKIDSVLIEGGAEIHYSALSLGIVNKIYAFCAPKIFGGNAKTPVGGKGVRSVEEAFTFTLEDVTRFENDVLLEYVK